MTVSVAFTVSSLGMGGLERVTTIIANALSQSDDCTVTLINLANKSEYFPVHTDKYVKPGALSYNWWRVRRKVHQKMRHNDGNYTAEHWVRRLFGQGRYDYLILNPGFFQYFALIKQLQPQARIYLWMHNNYDIYVNKYFAQQQHQLKQAASGADGIICLEHYSAARWSQWNNNVQVIHNPLTLTSRGHVSDLNSKTIACTSRLMREQKGLDYMVDVAERLPQGWHINIAGDGQDREWLEAEIARKGLENKLHLLGALDDAQLDEHYASSSMFLSLSRWEGFSLVTVEAMSRGIPVIAFRLPALEEVTDNGKYGMLVPLGDVDAMSEAIDELIDDHSEMERYAQLSLERAKAFDLHKIVQEWKKLVLNSKS